MFNNQLKSVVERIERLEEEKHNLAVDIKMVFAEAKADGFDPKILKKLISVRKQDAGKRREETELLNLYMSSIGMTPIEELASGVKADASVLGHAVKAKQEADELLEVENV